MGATQVGSSVSTGVAAGKQRLQNRMDRMPGQDLGLGDMVALAAETGEAERDRRMNAGSGMMDRVIGAGFAFVIGIIMLNFLFGIELVNNSSGPFSQQLGTVEEVIGAAIVLGALGILALAGYYARSMLGGS